MIEDAFSNCVVCGCFLKGNNVSEYNCCCSDCYTALDNYVREEHKYVMHLAGWDLRIQDNELSIALFISVGGITNALYGGNAKEVVKNA